MEYRKLGSTGMLVSRIGFGGIPILSIPEKTAVQVVRRSLEKNINYYDTHRGYGDSELKLGKALAGRHHQYYISTKISDHAEKDARKSLKESLKRLGTGYIDLLYIKNLDSREVFDQALGRHGSLKVAREAQKAGLVRHIGFTSHTEKIAYRALRTGEFTAVMYPYNILNPGAEKRILPYCLKHDIGFVCMKPVAGGLLTVPSKVFSSLARGAFTTAGVAIRFCLSHPAVTTVIPGIKSLRELSEALSTTGAGMTETERQQAEKRIVRLGSGFCRNCGYCKPCSRGIEINNVFRFYHYYTSYDLKKYAVQKYRRLKVKADACTRCGACLPRCPYKINIPQKLKAAHRVLAA